MTADGLALFAAVAGAHALAVMSPGPDFAMVTRQALTRGRAAGVWTAAGIGSGIFIHVAYGLFGLHWLTQRYPAVLDLIALSGAAFLLWMGGRALRAKPPTPVAEIKDAPSLSTTSVWRHYLTGLATNALNPKATLFFVALFTSVVAGPIPASMMWLLGLWLPLSTFAWFAIVALLLSQARLRTTLIRQAQRIDRAMGVILILLGLAVIADVASAVR